ncbi:hypothetical protein MKMG_00142 [Methanogenium sp. MK-MG]|nr:hypothetical protein MKMG_00142 [Methanogenium sp. MK-MG]
MMDVYKLTQDHLICRSIPANIQGKYILSTNSWLFFSFVKPIATDYCDLAFLFIPFMEMISCA